jgi:methylthioribose-1-phosphate isomerase
MERQDKDLAFLLRYENVAWYENGTVRILDRRKYPTSIEYVECRTYKDVVSAIKNMVTQSGGPLLAAGMGMALAAKYAEASAKSILGFEGCMDEAAVEFSRARPTTSKAMADLTESCAEVAKMAMAAGQAPDLAVFSYAVETANLRYSKISSASKYLVDQFPPKATIMTQCFAETMVGMMLKECRARDISINVICPETRPYFQGSRLTASVVHDMGFKATVITDNMPGYVLKQKKVDVFTSAADVICMDGHIVNKIGTFQIAMAAHYWGIPYFVSGIPDSHHPTIDSVSIEERSGSDVLQAMGVRTAMEGVLGYYPAFDITPPTLCDGVVTDRGVFSPLELKRYYGIV